MCRESIVDARRVTAGELFVDMDQWFEVGSTGDFEQLPPKISGRMSLSLSLSFCCSEEYLC